MTMIPEETPGPPRVARVWIITRPGPRGVLYRGAFNQWQPDWPGCIAHLSESQALQALRYVRAQYPHADVLPVDNVIIYRRCYNHTGGFFFTLEEAMYL